MILLEHDRFLPFLKKILFQVLVLQNCIKKGSIDIYFLLKKFIAIYLGQFSGTTLIVQSNI